MPKMRTNFQGLVRLLAKSLYPEPDAFIRELLQNAHDSIQLRRVQAGEPAGVIRIEVDERARTLSFSDNGTGMDRSDIEEFLSVIGSTGTGNRARQLAARDVAVATIGQFGIGLLSAFVVAERIEVYTRKSGAAQAWRWTNHGDEDYQLDPLPANGQPMGTQVVVVLAAEHAAFLDGHLIRQIVRRHADFLPFPILLNGFGPINAVTAPWHEPDWENLAERESRLRHFLSERYADSPLLVIPLDLPQPRALGALYIPARYGPGMRSGGTLDLFQTRMCIRANDRELLPEWAGFVRGLVDCPTLQPTAARDNVLRDGVYSALREALGEAIINALLDLATHDRPRFLQVCDWHHDAIKGMAARHPQFGAAILAYLPFETHQGNLTLPDFLARQPTGANGKKSLYFFTHEADANQFYVLCRARGLLVINAGRSFDEILIRRYADAYPAEIELKVLDRLENQSFYETLEREEQEAYAALERAVDRALAAQDIAVETRVRRFQPAELSAVLLAGQRISAFDELGQALEKPFLLEGLTELAGEVRDRLRRQPLTFFLNAEHPLIQRLRDLAQPAALRYRPLLAGLYYGALLNARHRLTPATARHFHTDLQALLGDYLTLSLKCQTQDSPDDQKDGS
jgi:molecular chaperone HtpG